MAAVDYDAPRAAPNEPETESLDLLQERREQQADDLADTDFTDSFILPGFEILDEELSTTVVPVQPDEFRCGGCFLVLHRGLHAGTHRGQDICRDCA